MSALQKLKAYFGMVPADDIDEYDGYDDDGYRRYREDGYRSEYLADESGPEYGYRPPARRRAPAYSGDTPQSGEDLDSGERRRSRPSWSTETTTHGALAVESRREPVARLRPVPEQAPSPASYPLGRIITLQPNSYEEARTIGEHYRDGSPVIMNLTEMADADAKRLVDFAAGLAFAMRGSIDKVTNKVFLISPPMPTPRRRTSGALPRVGSTPGPD